MKHIILLFSLLWTLPSIGQQLDYESIISHATEQALLMAQTLEKQSQQVPKTLDKEGKLMTSDYHWWCCGFFPGLLWMLSEEQPENQELRKYAELYTQRVEPVRNDKGSHDIGFMLNCSYGQAYRITRDPSYLPVLREGAEHLAGRFLPHAGVIKSWDWPKQWKNAVIIDNMMNLELLEFIGKLDGKKELEEVANSHAKTTMKSHYRKDYSVYHVVDYDAETGKILHRQTQQGYSDESVWARGQAWGLYGYTMMYRETGKKIYLRQAKKIADYLIHHCNWPEDWIPYWDFSCPDIPNTPRDASSAAIMASALLELSTLDSNTRTALEWKEFAIRQLESLSSPTYTAALGSHSGFILLHSTGNLPGGTEIDVPLTYADYYYIEALLRLKKMSQR